MALKQFDVLLPPPPAHVRPVDPIVRFDLIECVPLPHTSPVGGVKRVLTATLDELTRKRCIEEHLTTHPQFAANKLFVSYN